MNHLLSHANAGAPGCVGSDGRHDALDEGSFSAVGRQRCFNERAT
jgi:hypothetical protein